MHLFYTCARWIPSRRPAATRSGFAPAANLVAVLLCEYRRAVAASHRYQELRRKDRVALVRIGIASTDIAPHVLREFYPGKGDGFAR